MKTGVILPIFQPTPDLALHVAAAAEAAGVDGVFCYDHLWPMGQPERPALAPFPVLAAVGGETSRLALGTLVARVGLVPDAVLVSQFDALVSVAPGRVVAGLGTGDRLSAAENAAYGVPAASAAERRASLRWCAAELTARGVPVWVGGGAPSTLELAREAGAAVNLWDADPLVVADQATRTEVTWAGTVVMASGPPAEPPADRTSSAVPERLSTRSPRRPAPTDEAGLELLAADLARAGATWMVLSWPIRLDRLAAAAAGAAAGSIPTADC